MKIFDCFLFFNELDLLELRLAELYDQVDFFVLVEANKTHTGKDKTFNFEENISRYTPWMDKIIHVKVTDCPEYDSNHPEKIENFQRNAIMRGLTTSAQEGDKIMVSDVDEIPNMKVVSEHLHKCFGTNWMHFQCDLFYYYVNCQVLQGFGGVTVAAYDTFTSCPQRLRMMTIRKGNYNNDCNTVIIHAGWHYSYLCGGNPQVIRTKAENIFESYGLINALGTDDNIREKIKKHVDPYGRSSRRRKETIVDISHNKPKYLDEWLLKFPQYFYKET